MIRCEIDADSSVLPDCPNEARYEARLSWSFGWVLLCEEHAVEERRLGDVWEIRTLHVDAP